MYRGPCTVSCSGVSNLFSSLLAGRKVQQIIEATCKKKGFQFAEILQKTNPGQNGKEGYEGRRLIATPAKKNDFGSGARLGIAFKCVYRKWASNGADMFQYKENFIHAVLETYKLINEIAEKALETAA